VVGVTVRLDPRMVAMLAEIFMLRLEAERRLLVREVLPSSTSSFIQFSPKSNVLKESDLKVAEAPGEDQPVTHVR
jgi:hypothetical protein